MHRVALMPAFGRLEPLLVSSVCACTKLTSNGHSLRSSKESMCNVKQH